VPRIDKKVSCIETNNTVSSFSPVDHTLQVNFQEGEPCLLQCASAEVPDLCSNRFEKALRPNSNNDAKPRTVCSQEGENGIGCLHIKFTLAEDVFESRTTQKQGENVEYMFESRTTQMQEGKNDEDITNMGTPIVVAYNSMVKLFFITNMGALQVEFQCNGVCVLISTGGVFVGSWGSSTDLAEAVTCQVAVGRPCGMASTAFLDCLGLPLLV
jgi:hypothetical protein